jgi:hypothetical protein
MNTGDTRPLSLGGSKGGLSHPDATFLTSAPQNPHTVAIPMYAIMWFPCNRTIKYAPSEI